MKRLSVIAAYGLAATILFGRAEAQVVDSVPRPAGFVGKIRSALDSSGVKSADIRLMFVDSARRVLSKNGLDSLEIFVDTTRSRVGITDSVGNFSIRQLRAGRYLMEIRRIGYAPLSGVVTVDSTILSTVLTMDVVSRLLATVKVTAVSNDRVKERLDRVGFLNRYHSGGAGTFIDRADILRRQPLTVADILNAYGSTRARSSSWIECRSTMSSSATTPPTSSWESRSTATTARPNSTARGAEPRSCPPGEWRT